MVIAACGAGHDAATDAGPSGPLEIRGSCAFPLGSSGEVVFPDTAAAAQTSYRPIDVVNVSGQTINARESFYWTVEGSDAAEFAVTTMLTLDFDGESCGFHVMDTVPFPPGNFCRLDIEFRPTTAGIKQATLRATHFSGIDQTFSLRASAVAASAAVYADTVDLYVKPAGFQSFEIVNAGTTSVDLGDPVISGPLSCLHSRVGPVRPR